MAALAPSPVRRDEILGGPASEVEALDSRSMVLEAIRKGSFPGIKAHGDTDKGAGGRAYDKLWAAVGQPTSLPAEKLEAAMNSVSTMASCIPDSYLVGGMALRLHLHRVGREVPDMPALDLDYAISKEGYDRLRDGLRSPEDGEFNYIGAKMPPEQAAKIGAHLRRKGSREPAPKEIGGGFHDFMKKPDRYMAFHDIEHKQHIDLFADEKGSTTEAIQVRGVYVNVETPEELMYRRYKQVEKQAAQGAIQRKTLQYFLLNREIADPQRMEGLWRQREGATAESASDATRKLADKILDGLGSGTLKLTDVIHAQD
jgi:hypothetical protein